MLFSFIETNTRGKIDYLNRLLFEKLDKETKEEVKDTIV
jgi:hypothetical protein